MCVYNIYACVCVRGVVCVSVCVCVSVWMGGCARQRPFCVCVCVCVCARARARAHARERSYLAYNWKFLPREVRVDFPRKMLAAAKSETRILFLIECFMVTDQLCYFYTDLVSNQLIGRLAISLNDF